MEPTAIFLLAYGGPLSLDDVEPYLLDVRHGRPTPRELVEEVRERYRLIGGKSPLLEHTQAQARALEAWLHRHVGPHFKTFVGMRHWHPYIHEASVTDRRPPTADRRPPIAHRRPLTTVFITRWSTYPGFIRAVAHKVEEALSAWEGSKPVVVFTAHSLPQKVVEQGDPYDKEVWESARRVAEHLGLDAWHVAYQSAGASAVPWLGPDVGDLVEDLARQGVREVLVVPIGFVCDHVEILYDIDIELQQRARALGVQVRRTESLNDDPAFITALGEMVRTAARALE